MRRAVVVVVVFVLSVVAGCATTETPGAASAAPQSSSAVPSTSESTSESPAPPTTTTRTTLTKQQAAKRYLAIVRPYNVAMERLEKAINGGKPIGTLRSLAQKTLQASKQEMRQLRNTPWPKAAKKPAMRLANAIQQSHQHWRAAAQAGDRQTLVNAVLRAVKFGADAAKTIRTRLNVAKYDEGDYS